MKILHSTVMSFDERGILRQIGWEEEASKALGLDWRSVLYAPSSGRLPGPSIAKSHLSLNASGLKNGRPFKLLELPEASLLPMVGLAERRGCSAVRCVTGKAQLIFLGDWSETKGWQSI